jgi:MFS family permease
MKRTWSRLAAALLCAAIALLSPGPQAWAAVAAVSVKTAGPVAGVPVVPAAGFTAGLGVSSGLRLDLKSAGLSGASLSGLPSLSARLEAPAVLLSPEGTAISAATPILAAPVVPAAAAPLIQAQPGQQTPAGPLQGLQAGVETLEKAAAPAQKQSILSRLFTGSRFSAPAEDATLAPAQGKTASVTLAPSRSEAKTSASVPAAPAPAAAEADGFNKKAVIALFITRTLSISSFILTSIAFPFVAAPAVGWALYGTLMALGPLAAIATGPLNGSLADKLSARNSMVINVGLRAILTLALPAFTYFGILNFWTLLLSSVANGWVLSSTMTTENAYIRRLAGKHQATVTALSQVHYVGLQVLLGLIIGIGSFIDGGNPITAFLISALVHGLIITPILWFTMPNDKPQAAVKKAAVKLGDAARGFAKKYWKEALLVAGAVGSYFFLHSPLPIAASLFFWVLRTDTVRALRAGLLREKAAREDEIAARVAELEKSGAAPDELAALKAEAKRYEKRQFRAILYSSLQAVLTYPFQNFALPLIATTLMGASGKALLLGQLTGALFFGNLISNSTQVNLPDISIPFTQKKVPGKRLVQAVVLGLGAVWVGTGLVPGSLLAAAAAVTIAAGAMWAVGHLSPRGWIKFLGLGLAAIWLPYLVWAMPGLIPFLTVQKALFLTMLVYGMFTGPAAVSFNTYMQSNTNKSDLGKVFGTSSSFFNTFNSVGYGALAMAASLLSPVLPPLLLGVAAAYMAGAALFWRAPKHMPGLPESSFKKE